MIEQSIIDKMKENRLEQFKRFKALTDWHTVHTTPDGDIEHYGLRSARIDDAKARVAAYTSIFDHIGYRTTDFILEFITERIQYCDGKLALDDPEIERDFLLAYREVYCECFNLLSTKLMLDKYMYM